MNPTFHHGKRLGPILLFSPVALVVLIMLPRLLSPQFGLLDDGLTLKVVREMSQNIGTIFRVTGDAGRFLPAYWVFYWLQYTVAGPSPLLFFAANGLVLVAITACLIYLVRFSEGDELQAWASGLFFVLAGPVVESFYTLSKAEPPQLLWLAVSLVLMTFHIRSNRLWKKWLVFMLVTITLLLACGTKETTLVIIPISMGWFLISLIRQKAGNNEQGLTARGVYLVASLIAGAVFLILRSAFMPLLPSEGTYTRYYSLEGLQILLSASSWVSWLIRDFSHLIFLAVFVGLSFIWKRRRQGRILSDALIWMLGWITIFLPWHTTLEYYLLPFTLGGAVFGGVAFGQVVSALWHSVKRIERIGAGACLIGSLWVMQFNLVNNVTNARIQLTMDAANSQLVDFLNTLPANSHVYVNLPAPNEYVYELGAHLANIKQRPDISIDYFRFEVATLAQRELTYYVVTPQLVNQPLPSVRYAVYESGARQWNQSLQAFLGDGKMVYQVERSAALLDFGLHRLVCALPHSKWAGIYCNVPRSFVDGRTFSYGWQVYQVSSSTSAMAWPARFYPDGLWQFQSPSGSAQLRFGQAGDVPLVGDWNGDGFTEMGIFRRVNLTWYLDRDMDGKADIEFEFTGMRSSDVPVVGDWDGNGTSTPGYFRPEDVSWHFRNSCTTGAEDWPVVRFGMPTDVPITGDWDGDGRDTFGIYRPENGQVVLKNDLTPRPAQIGFGVPRNSVPVVADWSGRGFDTITIVAQGDWSRQPVNCSCYPSNPAGTFKFGALDGFPLAGRWKVGQ